MKIGLEADLRAIWKFKWEPGSPTQPSGEMVDGASKQPLCICGVVGWVITKALVSRCIGIIFLPFLMFKISIGKSGYLIQSISELADGLDQ